MVEVVNVTKWFGKTKVLDDVSVRVKKGTIHGIIGENGAGKTTILECIVGIYTTDKGEVRIDGEDVYDNNVVKSNIAYVADRNQYFKSYKINELVDFFKLTYPNFSKKSFDDFNSIMKLDTTKRVRQLSKGMQMRLSLILNLSLKPKVLVLDEPTSGLDAVIKKEVLDIILSEVLEREMTVIISSHHISELEKICDEVTIINKGRITYQSSIDELKGNIKKLQVVFKAIPESLEREVEVLSVENIGSVYYIVTDSYNNEFIEKLKSMSAILIEPIGITLEEIFVYTSRKRREVREIEDKQGIS